MVLFCCQVTRVEFNEGSEEIMGCDIHAHIEVQNKIGKWFHYGAPSVRRDYVLFSLMAGVRDNRGIQPIVKPRGLPVDISEVTSVEWEANKTNWHTPSYLMAKELPELQKKYRDLRDELSFLDSDLELSVFHTYVAGNSLAQHDNWENLRIVFWFDN